MKYLVATDGSDSSLKAARVLVQHAAPGPRDELFLAYVFPLPADPDSYSGVIALPDDVRDPRITKIASAILTRTRETLGKVEARVEDVVLLGHPAKEIVEFAMNLKVDLIVAGTRGRSRASEDYLGSVTTALIHRAPCSVLVVR